MCGFHTKYSFSYSPDPYEALSIGSQLIFADGGTSSFSEIGILFQGNELWSIRKAAHECRSLGRAP